MTRPALLALCLVFATPLGCSSAIQMTPAASLPFAQGEVDASFEDNGNGQIAMDVKHLGDPAKLDPKATVYIVWVKPQKEGAPLQNMGVLTVEDDGEGSFTFATTFRTFDIKITPEPRADVTTPSGAPVLSATISG